MRGRIRLAKLRLRAQSTPIHAYNKDLFLLSPQHTSTGVMRTGFYRANAQWHLPKTSTLKPTLSSISDAFKDNSAYTASYIHLIAQEQAKDVDRNAAHILLDMSDHDPPSWSQ